MGQIADSMIEGSACALCASHLLPEQEVFIQFTNDTPDLLVDGAYMPEDGSPFGVPVLCSDCNED